LEGPFTAFLAAALLGEHLRRLQVVLFAISLAGVFLLSSSGSGTDWTSNSVYGAAMILIAVACCAVYAVGCREFRALDQQQAMFIVSGQQTIGLITCVGLWFCHWSYWTPLGVAELSWDVLFVCLLTGPLKFLFATSLFVAALLRLPAGYAGGFLVLTPVFGLATAYFLLGEYLTIVQWIGVGIVLASVTMAQTVRTKVAT